MCGHRARFSIRKKTTSHHITSVRVDFRAMHSHCEKANVWKQNHDMTHISHNYIRQQTLRASKCLQSHNHTPAIRSAMYANERQGCRCLRKTSYCFPFEMIWFMFRLLCVILFDCAICIIASIFISINSNRMILATCTTHLLNCTQCAMLSIHLFIHSSIALHLNCVMSV